MTRRETALGYFLNQKDETALRAKTGIELYRKGDARIRFETADGAPLPEDITVEARQTNHEFRFGANLFMLDEFETPEKNAVYREKFPEVFNLATVPFYWRDLEPEQGKPRFAADSPRVYRRPAPDLCVDYCREKGIEPKCHCLNYDTFLPDWLREADVEEVKRALSKRFAEIAERYAASIPSFEVTNETLQDHCRSPFFFEDDFVEWSFRTADRYFPANRLVINDYNVWTPSIRHRRSSYHMQIERLLSKGVSHLDSIGMQFHSFFPQEKEPEMAGQRYDPESLYRLMDCYADFGIPEQITEMTIPAYSASAEDEDIQAELIKNVYTTFFSHPAMEAVIYWNVVDGYAYRAEPGDMSAGENVYHGALLRFDMSEKPAWKTLKRLIREEWHTETSVKAVNGEAAFRGFYGDYDVTVHAGEKTLTRQISLSKKANNVFTVVL